MLSCCPTGVFETPVEEGILLDVADTLLAGLPFAGIIAAVTLAGLWLSNVVYDRGVPHYVSRKIGHAAGGLGFLLIFLFFSTPLWPILLAALFGLVLLGARIARPVTFRGVGGTGRADNAFAEVWFPLVAVPVFAAAWWGLNRPEIAVACLLYMAWGDGATGLVRALVYRRPVKGLWGSLAMLCVCLLVSWALVRPFWIGLVGSLAATFTEWSFGDVGAVKWADDNWAIPLVSLGVVLAAAALSGNL
jgi:phytol kinase